MKRIYGAERFESRAGTLALDTETYYDTTYSVSKLGQLAYVRDPRFVCTIVSVTDGDTTWVGSPLDFNWSALNGKNIVAHNAEFDRHVVEELARRESIPQVSPAKWLDSASACAYLQLPRNLAGAVAALGLAKDFPVDKSIRTEMCKRTYHPCLPGCEAADPWLQYAALDPEAALAVWGKVERQWPWHERKLYDLTVAMGRRGVCVDVPYVQAGLAKLRAVRDKLRLGIPWDPPASAEAFNLAVLELGVHPPASTDDGDPRFLEWADQQAGSTALEYAKRLQEWRTVTRTIAALEGILTRTFNGRFRFELIYYGAGPGRWSGGGGWNTQNMTKGAVYGVDLRRCFIAPEGWKFLIVDLAQVEARALLWEAGDHETLALIRKGTSVYEAHARATMGYTGSDPLKKANKRLYDFAKARVLGLGYGCGKSKFRQVAKAMAGLDITQEEADQAVDDYRRSNPKIVAVWRRFEAEARARIGGSYINWLPYGKMVPSSCRALIYRNVREEMNQEGRLQLRCEVGGRTKAIYGGLLTENYIQGFCRDAFGSSWVSCDAAGLPPAVLSVHDELVFEVPDKDVEAVRQEVTRIMCEERTWAKGFPLGCESVVSPFYLK